MYKNVYDLSATASQTRETHPSTITGQVHVPWHIPRSSAEPAKPRSRAEHQAAWGFSVGRGPFLDGRHLLTGLMAFPLPLLTRALIPLWGPLTGLQLTLFIPKGPPVPPCCGEGFHIWIWGNKNIQLTTQGLFRDDRNVCYH